MEKPHLNHQFIPQLTISNPPPPLPLEILQLIVVKEVNFTEDRTRVRTILLIHMIGVFYVLKKYQCLPEVYLKNCLNKYPLCLGGRGGGLDNITLYCLPKVPIETTQIPAESVIMWIQRVQVNRSPNDTLFSISSRIKGF